MKMVVTTFQEKTQNEQPELTNGKLHSLYVSSPEGDPYTQKSCHKYKRRPEDIFLNLTTPETRFYRTPGS